MIVRRVFVEGWNCFANPVEIGPLGNGLNILAGPNGSGKSSLLEALIRGLFDQHRCQSEAIKRLVPWGRDLKSHVAVEFEHDREQYKIDKVFGVGASLSRQENGGWVRWKEGEAACQTVREMLLGDLPGRGETKPEHWGYAQLLWTRQGGLDCTALSAGLTTAIGQALGATLAGGDDRLENAVASEYEAIFTLKGLKKGSLLANLEAQAAAEQKRLAELRARMDEVNAAVRKVEDLQNVAGQLRRALPDLRARADAARQQAERFGKQKVQLQVLEANVKTAEMKALHAQQQITELTAACSALRATQEQFDRAAGDLPALQKQAAAAELALAAARQKREEIRLRRPSIDAAAATARDAARFVEQQRRCLELAERIKDLEAAEVRLQTTAARRGNLLAPTAKEVSEFRRLLADRREAEVRLAAAMITVRIEPERPLAVEVLAGEEPGPRTLDGQTELVGSPEVAVRIAGVGIVRATGPAGSVDQRRAEIADFDARITRMAERFGSPDPERWEAMAAEAVALAGAVAEAKAARDALAARGGLDELRNQRAAASAVVEGLLGRFADWAAAAPDVDALQAAAETANRALVDEEEPAERAVDQCQQEASASVERRREAEAATAQLRQQALEQQKTIEVKAAGRSDEDRQAEYAQLSLEFIAAREQARLANAELAKCVGDPQREADTLARQCDDLQKRINDADQALAGENGRLRTLTDAAPYSALAAAEAQATDTETQLARERLRAEGIKLLHQRIQAHRQSINQQVLRPVTDRATAIFHRITGSGLGMVFGANFLPAGIRPAGVDEAVKIDDLSGGEREQLYFAVRLALAQVLFKNERHLVVFDDAMLSTDTARMTRVLSELQDAAAQFQVLVLTCHPERYAGLEHTCTFDLEKVKGGGC